MLYLLWRIEMKKNILVLLLVFSTLLVGCNSKSNNNDYNETANNYMTNSKKSAFIDIASAYIDAVRTKVNEGMKLRIYSTDTLYMVPVGHDKSKSCVSVEYGGQSPFNDEWKYAYVGVTYDGEGYSYYAFMEDKSGQGLPMIGQNKLADEGTDWLYSSYASALKSGKEGITKAFSNTEATNYGTKVASAATSADEKIAFEVALEKNGETYGKTNIVYVGSDCEYKEDVTANPTTP
jgi:hypothetical protein